MRLQTFDLDPKTVNICLGLNERIGEVSFQIGFDNRIGDFLKLSKVTLKGSEEVAENWAGHSQETVFESPSEMNQVSIKLLVVFH